MKKYVLILSVVCLFITGCDKIIPNIVGIPKPTPYDGTERQPEIRYVTLHIDENPDLYTYEFMQEDLENLNEAYPSFTALNDIGKTMDGRSIYDFVVGSENASQQVIIHAAIHAREYITTRLVMSQLKDFLKGISDRSGEYNGISYSALMDDVAIHVIPMANPDGVAISQLGPDALYTQAAKNRVMEIARLDGQSGSEYYMQWKANANGVDLNRNYDAMWDQYEGIPHASSDHYKGTSPGSEPETQALIRLTKEKSVVRTLSYHTYGQVIYWYFGQEGDNYNKTKKLADTLSALTGYPLDPNWKQLDPAGYKDWAISKMNIPSVTIEVGYGGNPVPNIQFDDIYNKNKYVWAAMLYDIKY